jgi:diguanylate cyclase
MDFPDNNRLLAGAAGFLISAPLLWLSAEIAAAARDRSVNVGRRLRACGILIGTAALWWPGHLMTDADPLAGASAGIAIVGAMLAATLAFLASASAGAATRKTLPSFVGLATMTLLVGYAHSMFAAPGVVRSAMLGTSWLPLFAVGVLGVLLIALHADDLGGKRAGTVRMGTATLAAAMLALASSASTAPAQIAGPVATEGLLMLVLATVAAVLLHTLGQSSVRDGPAARRSVAPPPSVDSLTQLPTRVYFEDRLAAAATKCDASGSRLALLFIDLDGFKPVNDTYGHTVGDLVLEQVGQRLKAMSRGRDVVARVGGDEFLLLLSNVATQESVAQVATRLIDGLSMPYAVDGREVMISCSVGIALYPDGCSHQKLIARADAAMYSSKRAGGSNHCFYSPAMDADAEAQFDLLRDLRKALHGNELELFYQPKMDATSGKVTAVEALLRWKHPTRGTLLPGVFIPIAERSGLIGAIGNWVIEDACRQSRAWRDKGLRMRVAINLSAHQMRQDDIVERITGALEHHRIHPSLITCEITESAAMEDTKMTQATFRRLGELGVHLSIDDFGTGYSSLAYLRKLPAEELKIDRSFIMDLEHSADARAVVDAVIKLAHALGLKVVAEGVENQRQQQILESMHIDELQGFLFAKPMSGRALLLWAMNDRSESAVFKPSLFSETRSPEEVG